jgi:hypothetical protein
VFVQIVVFACGRVIIVQHAVAGSIFVHKGFKFLEIVGGMVENLYVIDDTVDDK